MKSSPIRKRVRRLKEESFLLTGLGGVSFCVASCIFWTAFTYGFHGGTFFRSTFALPMEISESAPQSGAHVRLVGARYFSQWRAQQLIQPDFSIVYRKGKEVEVNGQALDIDNLRDYLLAEYREDPGMPISFAVVVDEYEEYGAVVHLLDRIALFQRDAGLSNMSFYSVQVPPGPDYW